MFDSPTKLSTAYKTPVKRSPFYKGEEYEMVKSMRNVMNNNR